MPSAAPSPVFDRLSALADPVRGRLLLALERQELTVGELQRALQLPQSTVSRHLKVLAGLGLAATRSEGTSNWYRMRGQDLEPSLRRLWSAVREELAESSPARRDLERVDRVVADRHLTSQRFFASAAAQWDRLRTELFGEGFQQHALLALLDPGWVIADLGCGTGQLSAAVAPFVQQVIAVDESAAMLRSARQRAREHSNIDVRAGTLEALPIAPGSLDTALCILALHHVVDPGLVLASARRAIKPGGRLLVVDMVPHDRAEFREQMGHQWLGFEESDLARWLADAGFDSFRLVKLPQDPEARGPALFAATARAAAVAAMPGPDPSTAP